METLDLKTKTQEFFAKYKWIILAAILASAGAGTVGYRMAYKRGYLNGSMQVLAAAYRDNQQLASYADEIVENWTNENRKAMVEVGAKVLDIFEEELSKKRGVA